MRIVKIASGGNGVPGVLGSVKNAISKCQPKDRDRAFLRRLPAHPWLRVTPGEGTPLYFQTSARAPPTDVPRDGDRGAVNKAL